MSIYVSNFKGCRLKMEQKTTQVEEPKIFTQSELEDILRKRLRRERIKSAQVIQSLVNYIQAQNEEVKECQKKH